ncbi:hypothetical protein MKZ38_007504 [Zalerion maritima]|uniref:Endo-beta-1,6-galactanase-like domain-containing protein n=1 Tax=Zalerion maritima TaxID=339359 RepID=A0AAD5RIQ1_9PEZI|nr:hypothetical protein MKZ38_007504 [Zalerion maritima]
MLTRARLLSALAAPLILFPTNTLLAAADYSTTISSSIDWGTWEGWGTSLAWWAAAFGDSDDLADIFFSLDTVSWGSQSLPGLGFNIGRYNAGACSWNSVDGESMAVSSNMIPSRQIEGYWLDWDSSDPSSSSWDWYVDEQQRNMMWKARDRGANRFELFSNSPMWWMCYNHNPSGADDGGEDNLQSWNYQNHAVYLATIAKYAADNWGIDFETVEAFNEPMSGWWSSTGTQEGCHFEASTQAAVLPLLRQELDSRGLAGAMIAASDETNYDVAVSTYSSLGDAALSYVDRINVHGYQGSGGRRDVLYDYTSSAGKILWNSEYGESDATGESLVRNLMLDLRLLHPTAWVYWQVLDGSGWGLIDADNDAASVGAATQKYFCVAQFARHIREGMTILDGGLGNVIPAYDEENHKLVVVAANWDDAQYITFDLSAFSTAGADGQPVPRWATHVGSGDQYVSYPSDTVVSGSSFWSYFETGMVQTFEVENVYL